MAFPRYVLEDAQPDADETVTVALADGSREDVDAQTVRVLALQLERFNVHGIWAPRIIAATRATVGDLLDSRPFERPGADLAVLERLATGAQVVADAGITRTVSRAIRAGLLFVPSG